MAAPRPSTVETEEQEGRQAAPGVCAAPSVGPNAKPDQACAPPAARRLNISPMSRRRKALHSQVRDRAAPLQLGPFSSRA